MKVEEIKNEFKDYHLNDKQLDHIINLYKVAAKTLLELVGVQLAVKPIFLKIAMNLLKYLITTILDIKNEFERKNKITNC